MDDLKVQLFKSKKQGIKQPKASQNDILPRIHCSYLIIGKSGSGKTNVVLHMLNSKNLLKGVFDCILYICGSPDDTFKDNLDIPKENFITNFDEEWLSGLIEKQKGNVKNKGFLKTKSILLIFDDILSKPKFLNSKTMMKLVTECRHYNISNFFLTQSYKKIPRTIRLNVRGLIFFPSSLNEMIKFAEEQCLPAMSNKHFLKLINHATAEPYQFCFINHDSVEDKIRKNFTTILK